MLPDSSPREPGQRVGLRVTNAGPSPTPLAVIVGDVRAADAPGIAGGPLEVLLLVILLGLATMVATAALARVAGVRAH